MFNTLLARKEKMVWWLFIWLLTMGTIASAIGFYQWLLPDIHPTETHTVEETVYKVVEQVELGDLTINQPVRFMGQDLCVSSIQTWNLKRSDGDAPVKINLREDGDCQ